MSDSAIILLAHGSSDARWRKPFEDLERDLAPRLAKPVVLAFMELSEPSLETRVDQFISQNIRQIEVLPLFFAAGRHLREDVPKQIEAIKQQHDVDITLSEPIGQHPLFVDALASIIEASAH